MSIVNEKYSPNRINMLHQMLVNDASQGQPRDYEIKVDELKVVQRTDDPERFFQHEEFVQPDTQCIIINIFDGSSRRCTKYQLYFGEVKPNKETQTLSGVENTIKEKITNERRQWEYEQIKKENEELKKELTDSEEYTEDLETKLVGIRQEFEDFKKKRVGMAEMNTGRLVGFATDYLVKNHPSIAQKMPMLSGLSGLLLGEEVSPDTLAGPATNGEPSPSASASFNKKEQTASPQYDPVTEKKLAFFKQMEEAFTVPQLEKAIEIIGQLSYQPEQLDAVYDLLCSSDPGQNNPPA
jgi:hypothetical protein